METRLIVSAIIENKGEFLFGKKPSGIGPYPNTWHLIGGGVGQGESILEAVRREVREESGIEIDSIEPVSFDEDCTQNKKGIKTHYVFLVFKAEYKSGTLKAKSDIMELKWVDKSQIRKIELNRPTIKLFKRLKLL